MVNETQTNFQDGSGEFVADLDELANIAQRPVAHVLTQQELEAQRLDEEAAQILAGRAMEMAERQIELQRLTIEMLVTKAWNERLRQARGDNPEPGTRDLHLRNVLVKTLMTISADNADLSIGEYERL